MTVPIKWGMGERAEGAVLFKILNALSDSLNNFRRVFFSQPFLWIFNNLNFFGIGELLHNFFCLLFSSLFDDDNIKQTKRLISTIEQSKYTHIMRFTSKEKLTHIRSI